MRLHLFGLSVGVNQCRSSCYRGCAGWQSILCLVLTALQLHAEATREQVLTALAKTAHPNSVSEFHPAQALPCMNQGKTEICWSFATSSFVESEMARLRLPPVRLSVLYPLYCAYLEKTRFFVQTRGVSRFAAGDLFTGVPGQWKKYGALPASVYDQFTDGARLDHTKLYQALGELAKEIKSRGRWDEAEALGQATKILNRYLGEPPKTFAFNGKTYTPQSFADEVVRLPWNDYLMLTSFESAPFDTFTDLKVPDKSQ